ncbi:class I SAM-dependent methyltransferase [Pendulispora albinea]|uniref:S-adenosyl-L-methionine-dependent methyltransferase n=1 Tax=Pendulispora albinea TaxID=2741071 RepID=A0ABZ2LXQ9_9BACT
MQGNRPSATAMRVAVRRAAHQLLDRPAIFDDPLAVRIVGEEAEASIVSDPDAHQRPILRTLRAFLVARSRYAEDALEASVARGVGQYVVLGAGLDTFAYRNRHPSLRVFEVDYPATQAWKRERLAAAGIAVPPSLTFAPVDFEEQTLAEGLARAGLDPSIPTFFSWLGVTYYLSRDVVMNALRFVASRGAGTEIVFDFSIPPDGMPPEERREFDTMAALVAAIGEPWVTFLEPLPLSHEVAAMGYSYVETLTPGAIHTRFFEGRADGLRSGGFGHLLHARV